MKFVVANWKMNKTFIQAKEFFENFSFDSSKTKVVVFPSFTVLHGISKILPENVFLGAQNMHFQEKGAFTGEVSFEMLKECNAFHVLLGHSERRIFFKEDNVLINKKVLTALENNFNALLCVGENLEERESGLTKTVLEHQLKSCLEKVVLNSADNLFVVYEPVWAISNFQTSIVKKTASIEDIKFSHSLIRQILIELFPGIGEKIPILYGGSVSPDNAKRILFLEEVQGVLVGAASLDSNSFKQIISCCP